MQLVGAVSWGSLAGRCFRSSCAGFGWIRQPASAPFVATLVDVTGLRDFLRGGDMDPQRCLWAEALRVAGGKANPEINV